MQPLWLLDILWIKYPICCSGLGLQSVLPLQELRDWSRVNHFCIKKLLMIQQHYALVCNYEQFFAWSPFCWPSFLNVMTSCLTQPSVFCWRHIADFALINHNLLSQPEPSAEPSQFASFNRLNMSASLLYCHDIDNTVDWKLFLSHVFSTKPETATWID